MKTIYFTVLLLLGTLLAQAQPYRGDVDVTRRTLEERGDSLYLSMEISIRAQAVNTCQSWTIVPRLATADERHVREFLPVLINGKNKRQMYERRERFGNTLWHSGQPYFAVVEAAGQTRVVHYETTVPYERWMDSASLGLHQILTYCADVRQLYSISLGTKVKLEPRIAYEPQFQVCFFAPQREVKQRRMQGQAYLDFQVGRSVIIPTFRRNPEELAKIREAVTQVRGNTDASITGLFVEGYASPEGSYATNERLARERALALKDYMSQTFGLPDHLFKVNSVAEDWEGLKMLVEQSRMPQREQVLAIIDSDDSYDRKEQRLKALGGAYQTLLNEMFPQLRRVEYQIDYSLKEYSIEESMALITRDPGNLSQRELFLVAGTYETGSDAFNEVFDLILRQYPEDTVANINAAGVMLLRGEDNTAKRYLDKAGEDPRALNNLGVYYLKTGDLDRAETLFNQAAAQGVPEAAHNLGEVQLKREDNLKMQRYRQ